MTVIDRGDVDMPSRHHLIPLAQHGDERGSLVVLEPPLVDDFDLRRAYMISGVPEGEVRGGHAHRELRQILIPVAGHFTVLVDDGEQEAEYVLDDPATGLFLGRMTWRELRGFSADAVALVFASAPYDPDDYIAGRDRFRDEYAAEIMMLMFM